MNGTYPWSFKTQAIISGFTSRGGDRKTLEAMSST